MSYIYKKVNGASITLFWRETAITTSQSNNAMNTLNISSSIVYRPIMPYSGRILGMLWNADAAITAGSMDIELFINNVEATQVTITSASGTSAAVIFTTPQSFVAGQTVDMRYSSDVSLATITAINIILISEFD